MPGGIDQVMQAIGILDDVVQFLGHSVFVEIQTGGEFSVRLGQGRQPAEGGRAGGGCSEHALAVGPRVEEVQETLGLNGAHGIA